MNMLKILPMIFTIAICAEVSANSQITKSIVQACTGGLAIAETSSPDIFMGATLNIYGGPAYYGYLEFFSDSLGEDPSEVDYASERQQAGCLNCVPDIRFYDIQYSAGYFWAFPRAGEYCPESAGGTGSWRGETCAEKTESRARCFIM